MAGSHTVPLSANANRVPSKKDATWGGERRGFPSLPSLLVSLAEAKKRPSVPATPNIVWVFPNTEIPPGKKKRMHTKNAFLEIPQYDVPHISNKTGANNEAFIVERPMSPALGFYAKKKMIGTTVFLGGH